MLSVWAPARACLSKAPKLHSVSYLCFCLCITLYMRVQHAHARALGSVFDWAFIQGEDKSSCLSWIGRQKRRRLTSSCSKRLGEGAKTKTDATLAPNLPSLSSSSFQMSNLPSNILMSNAGLHKFMHHANVVFQLERERGGEREKRSKHAIVAVSY